MDRDHAITTDSIEQKGGSNLKVVLDEDDETQTSLAEGPKFNFASVEVLEAEHHLRNSIQKLKDKLQGYRNLFHKKSDKIFKQLFGELNQGVPELYRAYDSYVSAVLKTGEEKITCAKNCSNCCTHYVTSIEPFELLYLHSQIRNSEANLYPSQMISMHRRVTLFKTLFQTIRSEKPELIDTGKDEDRALYRYFLRGQPCPFLSSTGACGVYEHRPMSCRMFYSLSHPSLCKGKGVVSPENRNFLIELPNDIETELAAIGEIFADLELPESLFEGLLSVNEQLGPINL